MPSKKKSDLRSRKTLIVWLLTLVSLGLSGLPSTGQQINFKRYTVADGLCQNTVWCSFQDSQGFMWLGTKDGLNRFDGISFKSYRNDPADKYSIGNTFIRSIIEFDSNTLWIGTDAGLYCYDYNKERFRKFSIKTAGGEMIQSAVNSLIKANDGSFWIGTLGQGAFRYQPAAKKLIQVRNNPSDAHTLSNDFVSEVYESSDGSIWFCTLGGGLNYLNKTEKKIVRYLHHPGDATSISDNTIYAVIEDTNHRLWVGTESGGLNLYDRSAGKFTAYKSLGHPGDITSNTVREIMESRPGELMIGTEKGLNLFAVNEKKFSAYVNRKNDNKSISDNAIYSISRDKEGGVWVGTYFGGVNYMPRRVKQIEHYYPTGEAGSLSGKAVSAFLEDYQGRFWVGTEDGGLNIFNNRDKTFTKKLAGTNFQNIHKLVADHHGNIWIGTFLTGLVKYNPLTEGYKNYLHNEINPRSLSNNNVFSLLLDKQEKLWVGTISGLNVYDPATDDFSIVKEMGLDKGYTYDILQDVNGNIWFATYGEGVICYSKEHSSWKRYRYSAADSTSLSNDKVIMLSQDSHGRIWMGTEGGGLNRFEPKSGSFTRFGYHQGIQSNVIFGLLDDNRGNLWISSNNGLLKFHPERNTVNVYGERDEFQGTQFNYKAYYKRRDGKMFFGGINGYNAFYPENIQKNTYIPPVKIVSFQLFNKEIRVSENSPLKTTISRTDTIILPYDQSVISFEFVALSFAALGKNSYSYLLEGFDKEWLQAGNQRKVTYTNLPPGEYLFKVKASNGDGVWNSKGANLWLIITPPWWKTIWAYVLYGLLGLAFFLYLRRYILRSIHQKHMRRNEALTVQKEKELYQQKLNFFTTIAHEIRTPLSLIISPLENVMAEQFENADIHDQLQMMDKNSKRLLDLVNQLLDFRKVEDQRYYLYTEKVDLIEFAENIFSRFNLKTPGRSLEFHFDSVYDRLDCYVDVELMTKVLSNLLINAVKFTRSYVGVSIGKTDVQDSGETGNESSLLVIDIIDNGTGIPRDQLDKIFQPYFQLSGSNNEMQGTGIGLALAKSLTELHNGSLIVDSKVGEGSRFSIRIPFVSAEAETAEANNTQQEAIHEVHTIETAGQDGDGQMQHERRASILIVEDNPEVLIFLKQNFDKHNYHTVTARDGQSALDKITKYEIDLVLSDVMMPVMDGFEMCKKLKENVETSHLPVILITAKAGYESVVEGLEFGADAYLTKPFSIKQLMLQVHNMIHSRRLLQKKFNNNPFFEPQNLSHNKTDQKFIDSISSIVEENLLVTDFGVEKLSREIGMSRSGLHKKLKAMIGMGPNELIRSLRLKHAAKMILAHEYSMSEVAYNTGFTSPSYFTKCFTKEFGINPKELTAEYLISLQK